MPTITVRNVPAKVVQSLKALAKRHNRSLEQEVRDLLEGYVVERRAILDQIEAGWQRQTRRPTAAEVDTWMAARSRRIGTRVIYSRWNAPLLHSSGATSASVSVKSQR
jgi:plasmid stability protein